MKVGLFFGSFNPIHTGHLIIAQMALTLTSVQEIWFVVSPLNPFKSGQNLAHEFDRYDMVQAAIYDNVSFKVSDIEFNLPKPNYTIDTLAILSDKFPKHDFKLIIGSDNLAGFKKWKNHQAILDYYGLIVYPRPNSDYSDLITHPAVQKIDAPLLDISASMIRQLIKSEKDIKYLVPDAAITLIKSRKLYQ